MFFRASQVFYIVYSGRQRDTETQRHRDTETHNPIYRHITQ